MKKYRDTRLGKIDKKRKLKKRVYFIIPFIVVIAACTWFAYLYIKAESVFSNSYQDDGREKSVLRNNTVDPNIDNVSVLLMGVDSSNIRNNADTSRTDTLIVATLNKDDKSIKLLSIPRDSYVYIPEVGYESKITHAHAYGGPKATVETVENLLNIPIDYWVKINFEAFIDIVDSLDGINVEVPYEFKEQDSKDKANAIHLLPGMQMLNGEEALALARTRKHDNDIERGKRQQEIIKAIFNKAVSVNSVLKYDDLIEAIGSNMTTNMNFTVMKSFISYGINMKDLSIETLSLAGEDHWEHYPKKVYYYELDMEALEETTHMLKQHLNLEPLPKTNRVENHSDQSPAHH